MATNISAYETTLKLTSETNENITSSSSPGEFKRGLDVAHIGAFQVPAAADAFTVELDNGDLDVVYKFRMGGVAGTILATVTLTYATTQTLDLTQGTITRP